MNFENDKMIVDWMDVDALCLDISHAAKSMGIDKVVGISRGGLIPGVIISHMLNVPFEPIAWEPSYDHTEDAKTICNNNSSTTLFVDDICDSGITMGDVARLAPDAKRAVILNKRRDMNIDLSGQDLYNIDEWVVFPWESV